MLQYPNGNSRDVEIANYSLPILIQETIAEPERATSTWSAAPRTPATATSSRCRARSTRPTCDRDRSGRRAALRRAPDGDAGQPRPARPPHRRRARPARPGSAASPSCSEVDRVFSTYREDSVISRLGRGELDRRRLPAGGRARCSPSASGPGVESGGAFDVRRPGPDGVPVLDPSGVVKGWAVQRASAHLLARCPTPTSASRPAATWSATSRTTPDPAWRVGIEDPHDPQRVARHRRGTPRRGRHVRPAHRGEHIIDARTGGVPGGVASVTVLADDLTWADIDATAAYAMGAEALAWLRGRARSARRRRVGGRPQRGLRLNAPALRDRPVPPSGGRPY